MDNKSYKSLRRDVARFMRRLYKRGLTTASGGNISVRLREGIFITPSGSDKGLIRGKQVGMLTFDGKNMTPHLKPSIESAMHLAIYHERKDVHAIVHAHPPIATSFTASQKEIDCTLIAEARAVLVTPAVATYALMGTPALAAAVAIAAGSGQNQPLPAGLQSEVIHPNVIFLENHGIVCLGKDLLTAFDRLEVLEAAARMTLITGILGGGSPLSREQLAEIDNMKML